MVPVWEEEDEDEEEPVEVEEPLVVVEVVLEAVVAVGGVSVGLWGLRGGEKELGGTRWFRASTI